MNLLLIEASILRLTSASYAPFLCLVMQEIDALERDSASLYYKGDILVAGVEVGDSCGNSTSEKPHIIVSLR